MEFSEKRFQNLWNRATAWRASKAAQLLSKIGWATDAPAAATEEDRTSAAYHKLGVYESTPVPDRQEQL